MDRTIQNFTSHAEAQASPRERWEIMLALTIQQQQTRALNEVHRYSDDIELGVASAFENARRIDILTSITGVPFDLAWRSHDRPQDLADPVSLDVTP